MTEANSVHVVPRHIGVAQEVAMTSQLKRIRKCMLTTADRTCGGALGDLETLTDDVPRWARSGMLRWPACLPAGRPAAPSTATCTYENEHCSFFSLPSRSQTACTAPVALALHTL
jgi:hypothetical protein